MSTKGTLIRVDCELKDYSAFVHVYREVLDSDNNVFIESWIQGDEENYCETIVIREDCWIALKALIIKQNEQNRG